jgi:hypothetical protein
MLVKKELEQIPVLQFPEIPVTERKGCTLSASAGHLTLEKCGTVLVVDIFDTNTRALKLRFFCDGSKFLVCEQWPAREWIKRKPEGAVFGNPVVASLQSDDEIVAGFLKKHKDSYRIRGNAWRCINGFAETLNDEKQEKAMERKYSKREEHFNMLPGYPADLALFCETHVFEHTYIFISKLEKGKRSARCGHCRRKYTVTGSDVVPGNIGVCPKCGLKGKYRGDWVGASPLDKANICVTHRVNGQLIFRWAFVQRCFFEFRYHYNFSDYYRSFYIESPNGTVIYSYRLFNNMGWGKDWFRMKNGTVNNEETFLYAWNLNEVFGEKYYNVNLQAGLENAGQVSFSRLLSNLKTYPVAEYLFKMGLSVLASSLHMDDLHSGRNFSEVLCVSSQYLSLYRTFNVSVMEHRVIRASHTWVSHKNFMLFRALRTDGVSLNDIAEVLDAMSFERFVNYFTHQKEITKQKIKNLIIFYKDYISMSESLKVDLSKKSVRFPKNIKEAHDRVVTHYNSVKHEIENKNFIHATEKLYAGLTEFAKGTYCIVLPKLRSDLIAEGQSLNHCVGGESYYKNHIAGTKMIFFVRKISEQDKPFFTMEIDMHTLKINQLYGFGGSSPPNDVRNFANEFLRRLKPAA